MYWYLTEARHLVFAFRGSGNSSCCLEGKPAPPSDEPEKGYLTPEIKVKIEKEMVHGCGLPSGEHFQESNRRNSEEKVAEIPPLMLLETKS